MLGMVALLLAADALPAERLATDARVAAFQQFCLSQRLDPAATIAGFEQAGWVVVTESAHPELPVLMRIDRERAASAEAQSETVILQSADLFATVNIMSAKISENETARYATCAIWDLDADNGIDDTLVSEMTGTAAQVRLDRTALGRVVQWNLGDKLPGAGNLQTSYFPENSPAFAQTGFTGAAIFLTSDLDALP